MRKRPTRNRRPCQALKQPQRWCCARANCQGTENTPRLLPPRPKIDSNLVVDFLNREPGLTLRSNLEPDRGPGRPFSFKGTPTKHVRLGVCDQTQGKKKRTAPSIMSCSPPNQTSQPPMGQKKWPTAGCRARLNIDSVPQSPWHGESWALVKNRLTPNWDPGRWKGPKPAVFLVMSF